MDNIVVNQIVFALFVLLNLVIGLFAGRKVKTMQDYALANRSLGLGTLSITLIATFIEADYLMAIHTSYFTGILKLLSPAVGVVIASLVMGFYIFPRLGKFKDCYTLGDIMKLRYGYHAGIFCSILSAMFSILVIIGQLIALGYSCNFLGISQSTAIIITGSVITIYSLTGGIRSVAATDVIQFVVITVGITIMVNRGLKLPQIGGIKGLTKTIYYDYTSYLKFWSHPFFRYQILTTFLYGLWPTLFMAAPIIQRVLMTRNKRQITSIFQNFSIFYLIFRFLIFVTGMIVLVTAKANNTYLSRMTILSFVIDNIIQSPMIAALFVLTLVAIIMSTMDSHMNALVISIQHDIIKSIGFNLEKKDTHYMQFIRWVALFTGIFCTAVSLILINFNLVRMLGYAIIVFSMICLPFLAAVLGLKGSSKIFFSTILAFLVFFVLALCLDYYGGISLHVRIVPVHPSCFNIALARNAWFWATIASGIAFFVSHYRTFGGWKWVDSNTKRVSSQASLLKGQLRWYHFFLKPITWANNTTQVYGSDSVVFGLFIAIFYMLPSFTISANNIQHYFRVLTFLRIMGISLCCGLLLKNQWPTAWKRYYAPFYLISLFFCLPFSSTLLLLQDMQDPIALSFFTLHLLLLIVLVDWRSFCLLGTMGVFTALIVHRLQTGEFWHNTSFITTWNWLVSTSFTLLVGLLFARRKERSFNQKIRQYDYLAAENVASKEELIRSKQYPYHFAQALNQEDVQVIGKLDQLQQAIGRNEPTKHIWQKTGEELATIVEYLKAIEYRHQHHLRLDVTTTKISVLTEEIKRMAADLRGISPYLVVDSHTQQAVIQCDIAKVKKLLINTIQAIQQQAVPQESIYMHIADTQLSYTLDGFEGYAKKIPALRFVITTQEDIQLSPQASYQGDMEAAHYIPDKLEKVPSWENKRIIEAHYGFWQDRVSKDANAQIIVLPAKVRDIRIKAMDVPISRKSTVISDAAVVAKEKALKQVILQEVPKIDSKKLDKAIALAKQHHAHQTRHSGEPFYLHPLEVATIVLAFSKEEDLVIAAILHDVIEDSSLGLSDLKMIFGATIANLVYGVSKLTKGFRKKKLATTENSKKLLEEKDKRILMIKLADRIHNMRTIEGHPHYSKQRSVAEETLQFFVPLAQKLGLEAAEQELKSLVFDVLSRGH